ncbi:integral membrane protein [Cladophialophora carrionii]|uniref:Integral membrane protein n=1 Tax=Cladophialophora carrionii TaxID=86049 RepID=A0A1C1CAR2_9EURO|nr:integral membrane protein [Cladophialophora carrionii]
MARSITLVLYSAALLATSAHAQFGYGWWGGNNDRDGCPPWVSDCDDSDDNGSSDDSSSNGVTQGALFTDSAQFDKATRILIAHAVLASVVWVMFIPSLAILLRLNLKNPIVLKIHAVGQILSYVIYVVAAGMGIWLAQQLDPYVDVWSDPHPKLGLAILALAFFQPIFGAIHHSIYKKRAQNVDSGKPTKPPGRTAPGQVHLWLGRGLIALAIINGGLGIRLASFSPFQTDATSTKVKIAYGVIAATMVSLYLFFVVGFEIRRARSRSEEVDGSRREEVIRNKDGLPSYDESEESVGRSTRSGPSARTV